VKTLATVLLITAVTLSAQGQSTISVEHLLSENSSPRYTRSEIERMTRVAQTADDFQRLADYFDQKALVYDTKSQTEEQELNRLLALPFHARSYATQVESTRIRMDHFKALSHTYSEQAATYRERVTTGEMTNPVTDPRPAKGSGRSSPDGVSTVHTADEGG
jgi:acetyl-CoA acetyltransferase